MIADRIEVGRRLAGDLRRIREERGVEIRDVITRLKADPNVVQAFEETCLVDHPLFNRVYLRSFVREYADAIGIEPGSILAAVEAALAGRYDDGPAVRHLGAQATRAIEDAPGAGEEGGVAPDAWPAAESVFHEPLPHSVPFPRAAVQIRIRPGLLGLAAVGVALLALAVVLRPRLFGTRTTGVDSQESVERPTAPVVPARVVLEDTLWLWVVAVDTLNPVRITVDGGIRSPYWIEKGDSAEFMVVDRIVVEREVHQLELAYRGHRIPTTDVDTRGRLVLSRRRIQELLDSLRTAG